MFFWNSLACQYSNRWGVEGWGRDSVPIRALYISVYPLGFPGGSNGKESAHNVGDPGLMPGLGLVTPADTSPSER